MNPPSVYELTTPSSQRTSRSTKMVHNIQVLLQGPGSSEHDASPIQGVRVGLNCLQVNSLLASLRWRRTRAVEAGCRVILTRHLVEVIREARDGSRRSAMASSRFSSPLWC